MAIKKAKKKSASKKSEALGISGFTLGVVSLILLFNPLYGILASIVGFIFCVIQQKKHKTKLGKMGIYLNVIGFVLNIFILYFLLESIADYIRASPELEELA